jgi:NitT/TauT family transport system substrate-binding protein
MSRRLISPLLVVAVTLFTACGQHAGESGSESSERPTIRVGIPVAASTFLPLFLAEEEGLFEDEGVSVEIVTFRGGSDLVRAVVAGSVEIGLTSLAGVTVGISAGQPLKAFWAGYNFPIFDWYAVPSLTSVADVKGKRFGVTTYGSSTDFLTRYILTANGLDPDKDVSIVQGGNSATRLAAMQAGQLDVNIFNPPETFIAEDRGYRLLLRQRSLADDYPFHVFFSTESYIADHPDIIRSLLRAHVRGVRLAKSDRERAVKWLASRVGGEYAERTYDAFVPDIQEDGHLPSKKGLDVFFDMGVQAGRFDSKWPVEKYWISTFRDTMNEWLP